MSILSAAGAFEMTGKDCVSEGEQLHLRLWFIIFKYSRNSWKMQMLKLF